MMEATAETQQDSQKHVEPQKEHAWLRRLVGEWTYESEAVMEPGRPPVTFSGTETVRAIGDLWIVGEGRMEHSGSGTDTMVITLGYDPQKQRFVGTWFGSMMTHLWLYEGTLDDAERVLTLESEGPSMESAEKTARYRDVIEVQDDDHRTLTALVLGEDGRWTRMMTMRFTRRR